MRASIDGHPYSVGLLWGLAESAEDVADRSEESGRDHGVVLRAGKRIVGLGLAESGDDGGGRPPPAAAALLALYYREPVVAIEWAEAGQVRYYWLAAVADGAVVPGTDVLEDDPAAVHRHLLDLAGVADYRLSGTASMEFGGTGDSALAPAAAGATRGLAAIRPLRGAGALRTALLALVLVLAAGATLWLLLQPNPAPAPAPFADRDAELRREAIAARNRQLSADLSGMDALALARRSSLAGRHLQRSAAYWRLTRKECGTGGCTLAWDALAEGATPAGLATALGLGRRQVAHDLRAEQVTTAIALGAEPAAVTADESTVLTGHPSILVDLCRRFQGRGGSCALGEAQAPSIPNASLLPPELLYRTGKITLGGPLGRTEALLPLFAGRPLWPWVRADTIAFDYDTLAFRLEAHYVVP